VGLYILKIFSEVIYTHNIKLSKNNFGETLKELNLKLSNMSCQMCIKTIKNLLSDLNGIINVDINLKDNTGIITYDENILNEKDILKNEAFELYPAKKV
jgi:copper chaperone CopZ